jgi:hypothetical protein
VARQGDQGSFSFVILDSTLEVFNVIPDIINNESEKYIAYYENYNNGR